MRGLLLSLLVLGSACGKNNEPPAPSSGVPGAKPESGPSGQPARSHPSGGTAMSGDERAAALFGQLCQTCHGANGEGNGPVAASLPVKPRNYTDAAWQASVTDDQIKEIIVKGGAAVGKSAMMPGNPNLASDPDELEGLVKIIRGYKR
jgi:cytochrome c553